MPWRWRCGPEPGPVRPSTGSCTTPTAGAQYTSIRYSERLLDAGALASIGTVGDSYDTQAESLIGLYKTECVRHDGPWRGVDDLELATLSWVHWSVNQTACTAASDTFHRQSSRPSTTVRSTPGSNCCRENSPSTKARAIHPLSGSSERGIGGQEDFGLW